MKIFIDTAIIEEIEEVIDIIDGVTTNPSLVKKALTGKKIKLDEYIDKMLKVAGKRPFSLEVKDGDADDMYKQGKRLWKRFSKKTNNVYIKIPINPSYGGVDNDFEGLKVIKKLSDEGIPVNVTLIFTPEQALLAAKAGAKFVSPFAGRIDDKIRKDNGVTFDKKDYFPSYGWNDNGHMLEDNGVISGVNLVEQCADILIDYDTEVLAASIRSKRMARECAMVGADIATCPYSIIKQMTQHPKSVEGMEKFTADTPKEYEKILRGK